MAEIKSTMEKVMERAAKMAANSTNIPTDDNDLKRSGMRLAADYLNQKSNNLFQVLNEQPAKDQKAILSGMVETLLRNILIPRDELLIESGKMALQGVMDLGQSAGELINICTELSQILDQYNQHKGQVQQQLEDSIRAQLEQKLAAQGEGVSDRGAINPTTHPQYQEEMAKMLTELNAQYNQALDERKEMIRQRLSS